MFRTLRGRLTSLATGITLGVSLLVCTALYLGIRHSLYHQVDTFLAGEVMEFREMLSGAEGDLGDVRRRIRAELHRIESAMAFELRFRTFVRGD